MEEVCYTVSKGNPEYTRTGSTKACFESTVEENKCFIDGCWTCSESYDCGIPERLWTEWYKNI